jgi:hypothetical protein
MTVFTGPSHLNYVYMPVPELPDSSFRGTLPKTENENIDEVLIVAAIHGSGAWL